MQDIGILATRKSLALPCSSHQEHCWVLHGVAHRNRSLPQRPLWWQPMRWSYFYFTWNGETQAGIGLTKGVNYQMHQVSFGHRIIRLLLSTATANMCLSNWVWSRWTVRAHIGQRLYMFGLAWPWPEWKTSLCEKLEVQSPVAHMGPVWEKAPILRSQDGALSLLPGQRRHAPLMKNKGCPPTVCTSASWLKFKMAAA